MKSENSMPNQLESFARIKVVGVGGAGGNALDTMIRAGLSGVEFLTTNTDAQALEFKLAPMKVMPRISPARGSLAIILRASALRKLSRETSAMA